MMESATKACNLFIPNPNITSNNRCRQHLRPPPAVSLSARCLRQPPASTPIPHLRLGPLVDEFRSLPEPLDRVKRLLAYAAALPPFPDAARVPANRVPGCTAEVWLSAAMDAFGRMLFAADSDSEIAKGFCSCLISVLDGSLPEEVLELRPEDFCDLNVVGLPGRAHSRANTWHNVLINMQKQTKALVAERERRSPDEPFPALFIGVSGSYVEAQA